jgi:hypothetical protein
MKENERDSRDLILMVVILLLGLCFMLAAGQMATKLLPDWSVPADMGSNLDPNARFRSRSESGGVEPLRPEILTPPAWNDSYLTPMPDDGVAETAATLVVFDPSATPSATPSPSPSASPTTTVTTTNTPDPTSSPTVTVTTTPTKKHNDDPRPSPSPTPEESTPEGSLLANPANLNTGPGDGAVNSGSPSDGNYIVVDLGPNVANQVHVTDPSDTAPELVYYENENPATKISMDSVIVGISNNSDGNPYYEVFNWGDGTPDDNSNLGPITTATGTENDNQQIDLVDLYQDPGPPASPQTGVTIDVDNADSHPPPDDYRYVVIQAPASPPGDGNDGVDVDAIQVLP